MKKSIAIILFSIILISCGTEKKQVLFSSSRNGNSDIFLMNLDGSDVQQITDSAFEEWGAVWINKKEICFLRQVEDGILRIRKDLETENETEIDHPETCILDDKNAVYSPVHGYELFPCKGEVYYAKGEDIVALTEVIDGIANYPSWSPDGTKAFITSNHGESNDIYSIDIRSKELTTITNNPSNNERGEVSPNGKLLAFSTDSFEKGNQNIALMDLDSREVTRLTSSKGFDLIARWAGDNETLMIGSNKDGNWEIYLLNIHDKDLVRLTNNDSFDGDPRLSWSE